MWYYVYLNENSKLNNEDILEMSPNDVLDYIIQMNHLYIKKERETMSLNDVQKMFDKGGD